MNAMDHGPFVSSTIVADPLDPASLIAAKGVAVRVGPEREAVVVFDTDLLRVAAGWTGGFLKWHPPRDGLELFPSPDGFVHFTTGRRPGWAHGGSFADPRARRHGPLPRAHAAYRGLHVHGGRVVFAYSVGETAVLESPGFRRVAGGPVFTRTFNLAAPAAPLSLQVLEAPDGDATFLAGANPPDGVVEIRSGDQVRRVGFRGLPPGAQWRLAHRHLILDLPTGAEPLKFRIAIGPVAPLAETAPALDAPPDEPADLDLAPLLLPAPAGRPVLETRSVRGTGPGPFVVDELTLPTNDPWRSFLRLSAVDFLSDGRAVVASLSGDVWIVDGLAEDAETLRWTRFATGLNQPLGLRVVDDRIHVTGRDQITRLHDLDGNGAADFHENFNNEVMAATNFHAFTLNLDTDSAGGFLFAKATPWPPESRGVAAEITPHHGVLFRLPPDGGRLETIATGLRNPNGLSVGPGDEIVFSDNEGNWAPTSKVARVRRGGFHGFIPSAHRDREPDDFERPIAWIPHHVDNSPSTPLFITSPAWPAELHGRLLLTSYGRGTLALVLHEEVDGLWQGAHLTLPLSFKSGTMHARFHRDGHLYVAGLTSWQSAGHGGDWGSFHRVRFTGGPLRLPVAVRTSVGGVELRFAEPLDPGSVADPENFRLSWWTYPWSARYGTQGRLHSLERPGGIGPDPVTIESIRLAEDARTVRLAIPALTPELVARSAGAPPGHPVVKDVPMGVVLAIDYRLRAADGAAVAHVVHKTIHRLPGSGAVAPAARAGHAGHHGPAETPLPGRSLLAEAAGTVEIRSSGVSLNYDVTEIRMRAGERLVIRYVNAGDLAHNLVIVRSEADIEPVGLAALATPAGDPAHGPEGHRVLAATPLAQPGETVFLEFTPPGPGVFPYVCTFSGHFTMMQGRLVVER